MPPVRHFRLAAAFCAALGCHAAHAAEGFRLRYPLSGTLGGEMAMPVERAGWYFSTAVTHIDIDKVTDSTGGARQQPVAGTFATPQPVAGAVRTANWSGTVRFDGTQKQTQVNLMLGHVTEPRYAGGRLLAMFNLPYTTRLRRDLRLSGATPTLTPLQPALAPPAAAAVQAQAQAGFDTGYQANLAAQSDAGSGQVDGLGDAEVTVAWIHRTERLRALAGLTLALPTGQFDASTTVNVGHGNFYTLRPGVAVLWQATESLTLGGRAALGINSRNRDTDVRSGNFAALDLAAAWRTPIGVVGPHVIHVQQFQDDAGGTFGSNRFSSTGGGVFFTTLIPGMDAGLNVSVMRTLRARNALSGSFVQVRVTKAF